MAICASARQAEIVQKKDIGEPANERMLLFFGRFS
jgi:hypothetical protein